LRARGEAGSARYREVAGEMVAELAAARAMVGVGRAAAGRAERGRQVAEVGAVEEVEEGVPGCGWRHECVGPWPCEQSTAAAWACCLPTRSNVSASGAELQPGRSRLEAAASAGKGPGLAVGGALCPVGYRRQACRNSAPTWGAGGRVGAGAGAAGGCERWAVRGNAGCISEGLGERTGGLCAPGRDWDGRRDAAGAAAAGSRLGRAEGIAAAHKHPRHWRLVRPRRKQQAAGLQAWLLGEAATLGGAGWAAGGWAATAAAAMAVAATAAAAMAVGGCRQSRGVGQRVRLRAVPAEGF
jgi:hypothetical protein